MDNCLFCKIIRGDIPSQKIFENEEILVFKDISPAAPVHLLIIPKQHIDTLSEVGSEHAALLGRMLTLVPVLAKEHDCHVRSDANGNKLGGYKTLINSGPDGGQEVYHLHIHLIGGRRPWLGKTI